MGAMVSVSKLDRVLEERPDLHGEIERIRSCSEPEQMQANIERYQRAFSDSLLLMAVQYAHASVVGVRLDITPRVESLLRDILENRLSPALAAATGVKEEVYLRARRLPLRDQDKIARDDRIKVVLSDNLEDTRMIAPSELTAFEIRQVFSSHALRTPEEQRQWLSEKRLKAKNSRDVNTPYFVETRRNVVVFRRNAVLTRADIAKLYKQLGCGG